MHKMTVAAVSRRASLTMLGGASLTGLMGSDPVSARKQKKKNEDPNALCKKQASAWNAYLLTECAGTPGCLDLQSCAPHLQSCNFTGFLTCLVTDPT